MKKILAWVAALAFPAAVAAQVTISALPVASNMTGGEVVPIVQSGSTKQASVASIAQTVTKGAQFSTAGGISAANASYSIDGSNGVASLGGIQVPGFVYTPVGLVLNSSASATSNSAILATAMTVVSAAGGGTVQLPCGSIYVSSPVDNKYSRVLVRGCGRDFYHDGGNTTTYGTKILPTTAINVLVHETPAGLTNSKNVGGGFSNITVDGNNLGLDLLRVISVNSGIYDLTLLNSVGTEAAYFGSLTTGTNLGEAADIQYAHVNLTVRQLDSTAAQASNGVVLDGSSNANFSANNDVVIQVQHANGHALVCRNADNNNISIRAFRASGGTGDTIYGYGGGTTTGCYSNVFTNVSGGGPIYMRGTSDGDTGGVVNKIGWLDTANSSPLPTAGTASSWQWTESATNSQANARAYHMLVGNSAAGIINGATSQASTTTLDVVNDSGDSIRIRNSANSAAWGENLNGTNLRLVQLVGSNGWLEVPRVKLTEQTVATLPSCTSSGTGLLAAVSDAGSATFNAGLTNGGSNHVMAYCNGTNWTVH